MHYVPFNVCNSKRNWAKCGVGVKLIVILRHIIVYFSINIRWHSQNVSSDSRKWLIKHLFPPSSCKKQINKQNSYLLLAFLQFGSVSELDMHESKHFLPGQFVHSEHIASQWDLQLIFFMHNSDPALAYEATGRAFFESLHHLEKKRNLI